MPRFDRLAEKGKALSASKLNEVYEAVKRGENLQVEGGTFTGSAGGGVVSIPGSGSIYAIITGQGSGGFHSWEERQLSPLGNWIAPDCPRKGRYDGEPAKEINGGNAAIGSIVELKPGGMCTGLDGLPTKVWLFQSGATASDSFIPLNFFGYQWLWPDDIKKTRNYPRSVPIWIQGASIGANGAKAVICYNNPICNGSPYSTSNFDGNFSPLVNNGEYVPFAYFLNAQPTTSFLQSSSFYSFVSGFGFVLNVSSIYDETPDSTRWYFTVGNTKVYPKFSKLNWNAMTFPVICTGYVYKDANGNMFFVPISNSSPWALPFTGYNTSPYMAVKVVDTFNLVGNTKEAATGIPCLVQGGPNYLQIIQVGYKTPPNYVTPTTTVGGPISSGGTLSSPTTF